MGFLSSDLLMKVARVVEDRSSVEDTFPLYNTRSPKAKAPSRRASVSKVQSHSSEMPSAILLCMSSSSPRRSMDCCRKTCSYMKGSKNISIQMLKDVGMTVPKSRDFNKCSIYFFGDESSGCGARSPFRPSLFISKLFLSCRL